MFESVCVCKKVCVGAGGLGGACMEYLFRQRTCCGIHTEAPKGDEMK